MYLKERFDTQSSMATNYEYDGKSYIYQASDDIFGEVVINYNLTKKWELTGGASYKTSSVLPTTRDLESPFNPDDYTPFTNNKPKPDALFGNFGINPQIVSNLGAFLQGYFSSKKWNLVLGLRYDNPSNYDAQTYTRIAVMYKTSPKTSLRFSAGYAFKAPNLTTSYQSVALVSKKFDSLTLKYGEPDGKIVYQVIPSPNLAPEISRSIELGFRYALNSNTYLDISSFVNTVENLIVASADTIDRGAYPLAVPQPVRVYRNGKTTIAGLIGFQAVLRSKNIIPAIALNTNFAYSYQIGFENLGDSRGELNAHRQVPKHTLQWGISLNPFKKLYLNFDNVAMSGWYPKALNRNFSEDLSDDLVKGYYTLDATARYSFNKNLSTFLRITNVFDEKYGGLNATGLDVDLKYTPQMGRNVQFGISFKLE
jgi:outer membrane receptor protein involved in Fe transport